MTDSGTSAFSDPHNSIDARQEEIDQKRAKFCLNTCPGCKIARKKQRGFWYQAVRVSDDKLCPWCSSYARATGRKAYEPIPEEENINEESVFPEEEDGV